jgi:hypothetical protein
MPSALAGTRSRGGLDACANELLNLVVGLRPWCRGDLLDMASQREHTVHTQHHNTAARGILLAGSVVLRGAGSLRSRRRKLSIARAGSFGDVFTGELLVGSINQGYRVHLIAVQAKVEGSTPQRRRAGVGKGDRVAGHRLSLLRSPSAAHDTDVFGVTSAFVSI